MLSLKSAKELLSLAAEEYINSGPSTTRILELQEAYISVRKSFALNITIIGILLTLFGLAVVSSTVNAYILKEAITPAFFYTGVFISLAGTLLTIYFSFVMGNTLRLCTEFNKKMIYSLTKN